MKALEAISEIMRITGVTKTALGRRIGKTDAAVGMKFHQKSITVTSVDEMARALGYKIVLMPDTQPTPKGGYEIE